MRLTIILALLAALAVGLPAQQTINGDREMLGAWNALGATRTAPNKGGTALPATCTIGDTYFKTNETAGENLHLCTATNTWTKIVGGGGAGSGTVNSSTNGFFTFYGATGTAVSGLNRFRWNSVAESIEWYDSGGTKRGSIDVATGLPTFGIGQAGWTFRAGTSGGGTAKSGLFAESGDGANNTEPGSLGARGSSGGILSYLYPCGSAGKWCPSATEPAADSANHFGAVGEANTWIEKQTFENGDAAFLGYYDQTQIAAPANPAAGVLRVYAKTGAGICWRDSAGAETCAGVGGGGADAGASYLQLGLSGTNTAERTFNPRDGLVAADAGANGNYTLDFDITDPRIISYRDEFGVGGTGNQTTSELGWNTIAVGASATIARGGGTWPNLGYHSVTTTATSGQGGGICLGTTGGGRTLGDLSTNSDKFWRLVWTFQLPAAADAQNVRFRIGVGSCNNTAQLNDFVGLRLDTSAGLGDVNMQFFIRAASGTETVFDTTVAPDTAFHTLIIYSDGATANKMFAKLDNGTPVSFCQTGCDVLVAPPSISYDPVATIVTDTTAAKQMRLDFFAFKARVSTNADRRN